MNKGDLVDSLRNKVVLKELLNKKVDDRDDKNGETRAECHPRKNISILDNLSIDNLVNYTS